MAQVSDSEKGKRGSGKRSLKEVPARDWIKLAVVSVLYFLFLVWIRGWWGLLLLPIIFDMYTTHFINWGWWRDLRNETLRSLMSWVDAIVFALVAVYFVNLYLFQNYTIPSSSLEKSLLVGDYLYVSKVAYGPRKPITPLTMPLTNNTLPGGGKSYIEKPHWPYERVKGFGKIRQNDIVVFNYPSGDTIVTNPSYQVMDYYGMVCEIGSSLCRDVNLDSLSLTEQRRVYDFYYKVGRDYILKHPEEFGKIDSRPVDRRENYVKRCVGLPGQTLQIKDGVIYIDGQPEKTPDQAQFNYKVTLLKAIPQELRDELCLSLDDLPERKNRAGEVTVPLTASAASLLVSQTAIAGSVERVPVSDRWLFPLNLNTGWTIDNYGPIYIPQKGATVQLDLSTLPFYERAIKVYEGNDLKVSDSGVIMINGAPADSYTFKMDYYWMMGDNRHNSADSRYWGFVPEDHIVGRPVLIWLSLNKDKGLFHGKIRWNRLFHLVRNYN
ncbi:MAG: S26 family signal peptidase [Bacteroidaceae bacterium]|nr:S26 family signal peptidase [Bacteroidaceae bacterium]